MKVSKLLAACVIAIGSIAAASAQTWPAFAHGFARARCEDCGHDFFDCGASG